MRSQRDIEAELDALLGRKKHHWWRWVLLALGGLFGLILLVAVGAAFMIYQRLAADLPQVSELEHYQPSLVTKVYDRYGELIADFFIENRILDRKSTRLNSSHGYISYAVFCLKKKKIKNA